MIFVIVLEVNIYIYLDKVPSDCCLRIVYIIIYFSLVRQSFLPRKVDLDERSLPILPGFSRKVGY